MSYRVELQNFEGPLDLLLFLIKKNEVDIYDIPIAEITEQFLAYVQVLEILDIDHASEFILMAATLIRIKAKMLLPRSPLDDEEESEDPREELVQRLLEYQRYKEVAEDIGELEREQRKLFPTLNFTLQLDEEAGADELQHGQQVTLYELMSVFTQVLKRMPAVTQHTVERIPVTIEEQSEFILNYLDTHERVLFTELLGQVNERIILIVTFIAILELVRNKRLKLNQSNPFSEIWIQKN